MIGAMYIVTGVLVLTAVTAGLYYSQNIIEEDTFKTRNLIDKGTNNKTLWLYYDQSDVNSRWWADFGARSSRVLNTPFMNLCYQTIVMKNGQRYNVKVLAGLSDVAVLLGGWKELPKPLQNPIASVNEAVVDIKVRRLTNVENNGAFTNFHSIREDTDKIQKTPKREPNEHTMME
jgi:hypothetical protein